MRKEQQMSIGELPPETQAYIARKTEDLQRLEIRNRVASVTSEIPLRREIAQAAKQDCVGVMMLTPDKDFVVDENGNTTLVPNSAGQSVYDWCADRIFRPELHAWKDKEDGAIKSQIVVRC